MKKLKTNVFCGWTRKKNTDDKWVYTEMYCFYAKDFKIWCEENQIEIENKKVWRKK